MIVLSTFIFNRIRALRSSVIGAKSERDTLAQRVETLRTLEPQISSQLTQIAYNALPPESSPLVVASQLKSLARDLEVSLSSFRVFTIFQEQDVNSYEILFEVEGEPEAVFGYLTEISKLTPLVNISDLKISTEGDLLKGKVKSTSFWTPLTTKLPSLNEPIQTLNAEEKSIITKLLDFKAPPHQTSLSPDFPSETRADPFSVVTPSELPQ